MTESNDPFAFQKCDLPGCTVTTSLKLCSQCKCFAFCGREHQAAFWKLGHKKECAEINEMRESGRKSTEDIRVLSFAAMETKGADSSASGDEFMPPGAWAAISSQGCSCGASGSSCCGAGGNGDPMALYRQLDGVDGEVNSWFTGMFFIRGSTVPAFFKVHDLGGELDGPNHKMTMDEVMSEFGQYVDAGKELQNSFTKVALLAPGDPILSMEPKKPLSAKDMALFFKDGRNCGLVDFSSKPVSYTDSQEDTFDLKYPFPDDFKPSGGTLRLNNWRWSPDVRAGDLVRVMVSGIMKYSEGCGNPKCGNPYCGTTGFTEKMWVRVLSVTSFGVVTGTSEVDPCHANSYLANKKKAPILSFPITCCIGVMKSKISEGGHWD